MTDTKKIKCFFLLLSFFLMGADTDSHDSADQRQLSEQRTALNRKIEQLKREHDFLLFQKEFSSVDSKYLILDLAAGKGQLKYKHVILKDFLFSVSPSSGSKKVPAGSLTLTKKKEKPSARMSLLFGKTLLMQSTSGGKSGKKERGTVYLSLKRKDLNSVFYALEEGAQAYIKPVEAVHSR